MCDSDPASVDYFNKHLKLMESLGQNTEYKKIESITDFFDIKQGETNNEKGTIK